MSPGRRLGGPAWAVRAARSYTGGMDSKRAWIGYTVVRVLAFAVPFAAVMLILPDWPYSWIVGALVGTVVGLAVSYLFLRDQRTRMGDDLAELRSRRDQRTRLDREEDAELDEPADGPDTAADGPGPATDATTTENETESQADTESEAGAEPSNGTQTERSGRGA